MRKVDGLTHSIGTVEEGYMHNIDMMSRSDPAIAATARLNRDLMNLMDSWMRSEGVGPENSGDLVAAISHGVASVCGTILINLEPDAVRPAHVIMKSQINGVFDAMLTSVEESNRESN